MRVAPVPWDDADGAALRARQQDELRARYAGESEPGTPPSGADVALFLVARDAAGAAVGCGGLRPLEEGVAEIKRMYVDPLARGTGVADALLAALEAAATERGWTTLRLETGERQPDAMRFYARAGYAEIPPFGPYVGAPFARCFERRLA
ncbi:GNAT family N-acetyltransferase [Patulibacter sp. SYSU D01012]|uniref:GNAT family N-acetyltransferase n=1 Tax=Patulibacter sp. SYSU D01012 TaxID=2817381 RepID=UPI001B30C697